MDYSYYTTDDPAFAGLRNDASHWNGEKYLNIDLTSGGDGIYITNGKAIDVTWKKEGKEVDGLPTKVYDKKTGEEITYNKGKTWYCVILSDRWDLVTINDEKVNPEASPSPESPAVTAEPAQTQTETPAAQEPAQTQTEEKKTETTTEAKPEEPAQPATVAAPAPAPEQPAPEPAPEPEPEIPIIMEDFNPAMGEG